MRYDHYYCKTCNHCFKTPYRQIPDECPICHNPHYLRSITKGGYETFKDDMKNSIKYRVQRYNEYPGEAKVILDRALRGINLPIVEYTGTDPKYKK